MRDRQVASASLSNCLSAMRIATEGDLLAVSTRSEDVMGTEWLIKLKLGYKKYQIVRDLIL